MPDFIGELFKLNEELELLADKITNTRIFVNEQKGHYLAIAYGKGFKTFSAILLLCRNGYGQDGLVLSRTLFELTVNTFFIFIDPTNKTIDRYFAYQAVLRKKAIQYHQKDKKLNEILIKEFELKAKKGETIESVLNEAEKMQEKYNFSNNKWSKHDLAYMSKEVGLEHMYLTLYKVQNDLTHSTVGGLDDYIYDENDSRIVKTGADFKWIEQCLFNSFHLFSLLTGQFCITFSINKQQELKDLTTKLIAIDRKTI